MSNKLLTKLNSGAASATILISDTFTDADSTALTAHTIAPTNTPATSWSAITPWTIFSITSNKIKASATNTAAKVDAGKADVTITADYTFATGATYDGILCRVTDIDNYVRVSYDSGTWTMFKRVAASNTTLGTALQTLTNGVTYALKIVASGTTITFFVDGVQKIEATGVTNFSTVTKHGLYMSSLGGTTATFDSFKITNP